MCSDSDYDLCEGDNERKSPLRCLLPTKHKSYSGDPAVVLVEMLKITFLALCNIGIRRPGIKRKLSLIAD